MKKLKIVGVISSALIGGGALVSVPLTITSCAKHHPPLKQIDDFDIICSLDGGALANNYADQKFYLSTNSAFNDYITYSINFWSPNWRDHPPVLIQQDGNYEVEIKSGLNLGIASDNSFYFNIVATFNMEGGGYETKVEDKSIEFTVFGTQTTGNSWGSTMITDSGRTGNFPYEVHYNPRSKKLYNPGFTIYDPYISDTLTLNQQSIEAGGAPGYWLTWQIEVNRASGHQWLDELNSDALGKILFGLQNSGQRFNRILYITNINFGNDLFRDNYLPTNGQKSQYKIIVTLNAPGFVTYQHIVDKEISFLETADSQQETLPSSDKCYDSSDPNIFVNSINNQPINFSRFWFNISKPAPTDLEYDDWFEFVDNDVGGIYCSFVIGWDTHRIRFTWFDNEPNSFVSLICENSGWESEHDINSSSNGYLEATTHLITNGLEISTWIEVEVLIFSHSFSIIADQSNWGGNEWTNDMTNWFIQRPTL